MKQQNQRSPLHIINAVCNQMEEKKHGHGVAPRYREQQTHLHLKYNQRNKGKHSGQEFSKEYLKEFCTSNNMVMKYMHFDWGKGFEIKLPNNTSTIEISSFRDLCAECRLMCHGYKNKHHSF